ncbi:uncharacterized protein K489DRAFT_408343 [Dissoconium aciculare CBS 342.82]|uniref:MARVEL domain-containing protein n=1 Tax=Dissoconium aciculare CBS 342.82 TaxID=1314786 RepID=A0A6J3MDQ1_9PEZI|nr:uncharacterized protein K489DRAFT_408343 [Dissoconium aciculare CBS 342.82]KAF1825729.1 hypothetical protein K489DRAFT_408343 [Dissoconium aciculare CBS 342.82]
MEGKGLINIVARALQFLWTLLVMAITGNMIHSSWSGTNSAPSIINYTMFCAVWAMLTLFYLIPATVKDSFQIHAALPFALDVLNTVFWFCAAVAFAAKLGAHSCSDVGYVMSNEVTSSAPNMEKQCREGQAVTAFLWFGFAAFAVSTALTGLGGLGGGSSRRVARGPQMSKV